MRANRFTRINLNSGMDKDGSFPNSGRSKTKREKMDAEAEGDRAMFNPLVQIHVKPRRFDNRFIPLKTLLSAPLRPPRSIFISLRHGSVRASN
jgi:hypothetical protein